MLAGTLSLSAILRLPPVQSQTLGDELHTCLEGEFDARISPIGVNAKRLRTCESRCAP